MKVTNLQNANIETLTPLIKNEYEKIYFEFSIAQQKPIYLRSVLNSILTYKSLNILLNDENKTFTNKDFIKYQDMFNTGFKEGYLITKEYIDGSTNIKIKIDRVFDGIYKKLNSLKETHTFLIKSDDGNYSFELMEYYNYSIEVGEFVVCWDYILNNSSLFEDIFNLNYTKNETTLLTVPTTGKTKQNKSLLFDGKELNLLERFKIADKVLDIDKKLRVLNIGDLEKYQLLAYILGCDKDNARNLMNGSYKAKPRDLSTYFNDLDLNK